MEENVKIVLPKLGESIVSATVVQWFKKVGDKVERDEPLLEVSTDKVNSEIPSPVSGYLTEIYGQVEQEIQVGEALALISSTISSTTTAAPKKEEEFLTPAVKTLLKEKCITDIAQIPRTGQCGRLTKKDVEQYKVVSDDRIKMSPLRKAIADNMVKSFYEAPHASLVTEVDVTNIVKHIAKEKQAFLAEHGVKLSITAYAAQAITRALNAYPLLNSSLDSDTIIMKRHVNLGIAVSVDQGVMVPVVRNTQNLSLVEISKEIGALAEKARTHALAPADVQNGTITMTNFGMTGTLIGVPIIRYPEVAIVGLGAITKKVAAMPDDSIAVRSVMMVSLTFDHRVLDGLYGCGFLGEVKKILESELL